MDRFYFDGNPWDVEDEKRYGTTRRVFALALDMDYRFEHHADADPLQKLKDSYGSVKALDLMAEISENEDKLYEINREIDRILIHKETFDITSFSKFEKRISQLSSFSSHLVEVVDNKSEITSRLQQPCSRENLFIDASQHRCVVEFFTLITPLLSDLSALLDTISWSSSNSSKFSADLERVLSKMASSLQNIKFKVERLAKLRTSIQSSIKSA